MPPGLGYRGRTKKPKAPISNWPNRLPKPAPAPTPSGPIGVPSPRPPQGSRKWPFDFNYMRGPGTALDRISAYLKGKGLGLKPKKPKNKAQKRGY